MFKLINILLTASNTQLWLWGLFAFLIIAFLVIDLGFAHRKATKISTKSALIQTIIWVSISLGFSALIYLYVNPEVDKTPHTHEAFLAYISCYLTEYALSVDNIFVIILILKYFRIEEEYHHDVLFWGILGAVLMRGLFIVVGVQLVHAFHEILYIFGLFLVYTGIKLMTTKEEDEEYNPEKNVILKLSRRFLRLTSTHEGGKFFIRKEGVLFFTPLFLVLILIESTDLIFAVDSIPVAFGITSDFKLEPDDELVVLYTSNIFAVMGLRAMFFLLQDIIDRFYLLQKALSFILIFIGAKMLFPLVKVGSEALLGPGKGYDLEIPPVISFSIILGLLFGSVLLSLLIPKRQPKVS